MRRFFWFPLVFRFLTRFWDGVARSCVPKKKYIVWWFPLFFSEFQILVSNRYVDYEDAFFEGARIGKC